MMIGKLRIRLKQYISIILSITVISAMLVVPTSVIAADETILNENFNLKNVSFNSGAEKAGFKTGGATDYIDEGYDGAGLAMTMMGSGWAIFDIVISSTPLTDGVYKFAAKYMPADTITVANNLIYGYAAWNNDGKKVGLNLDGIPGEDGENIVLTRQWYDLEVIADLDTDKLTAKITDELGNVVSDQQAAYTYNLQAFRFALSQNTPVTYTIKNSPYLDDVFLSKVDDSNEDTEESDELFFEDFSRSTNAADYLTGTGAVGFISGGKTVMSAENAGFGGTGYGLAYAGAGSVGAYGATNFGLTISPTAATTGVYKVKAKYMPYDTTTASHLLYAYGAWGNNSTRAGLNLDGVPGADGNNVALTRQWYDLEVVIDLDNDTMTAKLTDLDGNLVIRQQTAYTHSLQALEFMHYAKTAITCTAENSPLLDDVRISKFVNDEVVIPDTNYKNISTYVGADETKMNFTWYSNVSDAGVISVAKSSEVRNDELPVDARQFTAEVMDSTDEGWKSNQVTVDELEANTEYTYQISNGLNKSELYTFKTDADGEYGFVYLADAQLGASGDETSDINSWKNTLNRIETNVKFSDAAFILSLGDQIDYAHSNTQYQGFLEHKLIKSLPLATNIGNHEYSDARYNQYFNMPNESNTYGVTLAGGDYYFTYNNTLFISLNTNSVVQNGESVDEHIEFIEKAIEDTKDLDIKWKVVTQHHSIYTVGKWADGESELALRDDLVPVFDRLGIDVVLMGHDHIYCRTYMMDGLTPVTEFDGYEYGNGFDEAPTAVYRPTGTVYVTANSSTGSKYNAVRTDLEFPYSAMHNQANRANISKINVTDNSFEIVTYCVDDMNVVDSFTIYKSGEPTYDSSIDENVIWEENFNSGNYGIFNGGTEKAGIKTNGQSDFTSNGYDGKGLAMTIGSSGLEHMDVVFGNNAFTKGVYKLKAKYMPADTRNVGKNMLYAYGAWNDDSKKAGLDLDSVSGISFTRQWYDIEVTVDLDNDKLSAKVIDASGSVVSHQSTDFTYNLQTIRFAHQRYTGDVWTADISPYLDNLKLFEDLRIHEITDKNVKFYDGDAVQEDMKNVSSLTDKIELVFSNRVRTSTLTKDNVFITKNSDGTKVEYTSAWDSSNFIYSINFDSLLIPGEEYTLTVQNLKSMSGTDIEGVYTCGFKVGQPQMAVALNQITQNGNPVTRASDLLAGVENVIEIDYSNSTQSNGTINLIAVYYLGEKMVKTEYLSSGNIDGGVQTDTVELRSTAPTESFDRVLYMLWDGFTTMKLMSENIELN